MADTFDMAIKHYGKENQSIVAIEELSELQKEICKALRGRSNKKEITEEMADVYIMLTQLERIYGIDYHEVMEVMEEKRWRLDKRIADEVYLQEQEETLHE